MNVSIDKFLNIEKKYDLYHKEVEGIQCWQYIRFQLWNYKICSEQLRLSSSRARLGKLDAAKKIISSLIFILFHPDKNKLCKADVCFVAHERRIKEEDYFECIYTDKLATFFYPNSFVLEKPFRMGHLRPVKTKNLYYTDFLSVKAGLKCLFQMKFQTKYYRQVKEKVHRIFGEPLSEIIREFNLSTELKALEEQLIKIVLECRTLQYYYMQVLNTIQPKVIVEVVGYSKMCMIINELAKKMGIITMELQHGTMHSEHAAYQYANDCQLINQFPDMLLVFSDYWKHCVQVPIKKDMIKTVGFPYFERKLAQYSHVQNSSIKNILFVSQGTIGKELSKMASELNQLLDPSKYHIVYKLHPEEYFGWQERYPWLIQPTIEVVDSLEHNIYEYFAMSDIQVGVYSTALFEGLGFGLFTYIYRIGHADTMKELCKQRYATFVESASELSELIISENENSGMKAGKFWESNGLENIKKEIEECLKRIR